METVLEDVPTLFLVQHKKENLGMLGLENLATFLDKIFL
jgi:hypothetical protein